jgi:hypothetical protein
MVQIWDMAHGTWDTEDRLCEGVLVPCCRSPVHYILQNFLFCHNKVIFIDDEASC